MDAIGAIQEDCLTNTPFGDFNRWIDKHFAAIGKLGDDSEIQEARCSEEMTRLQREVADVQFKAQQREYEYLQLFGDVEGLKTNQTKALQKWQGELGRIQEQQSCFKANESQNKMDIRTLKRKNHSLTRELEEYQRANELLKGELHEEREENKKCLEYLSRARVLLVDVSKSFLRAKENCQQHHHHISQETPARKGCFVSLFDQGIGTPGPGTGGRSRVNRSAGNGAQPYWLDHSFSGDRDSDEPAHDTTDSRQHTPIRAAFVSQLRESMDNDSPGADDVLRSRREVVTETRSSMGTGSETGSEPASDRIFTTNYGRGTPIPNDLFSRLREETVIGPHGVNTTESPESVELGRSGNDQAIYEEEVSVNEDRTTDFRQHIPFQIGSPAGSPWLDRDSTSDSDCEELAHADNEDGEKGDAEERGSASIGDSTARTMDDVVTNTHPQQSGSGAGTGFFHTNWTKVYTVETYSGLLRLMTLFFVCVIMFVIELGLSSPDQVQTPDKAFPEPPVIPLPLPPFHVDDGFAVGDI